MSIDSTRAKEAALWAASTAMEKTNAIDAEAKEIITKAIASAIEAAFDALQDMQDDERRRRFN